MPSIAEAFITLRPDLSQFENQTRGFFRARAGVFTAIGAAAVSAGVVLGLAKPAAEVEQQLNILQAAVHANSEEMEALAQRARELGADLTLPATSSKDAAIAMTELAKGGLAVKDIMTATKGVLQLTASDTIATARAAEITVNALNNFNLAGTEAAHVADLLAAAANSASGGVEDMAQGLEAVGALAKQAGVPIDDVVTSIAIMAKAGTIGAEAGYQLRNMFVQLNSVTPEARKMMEAVGFDAFDAAGNMKPLRDIIADLTRVTKGMTQEARGGFLDKVFGTRASIAVINLLDAGVDGFNEMSASVTKQGAAADMAAARNKGLLGAFDGLKSSVSTLAIDLGTKLLPRMTEAVRGFAGLVNQAHTVGPALREIGKGVAEAFGVAKSFAQGLYDTIRTNTPLAIAAVAALGAAIYIALGPAGVAVGAFAIMTAALVGFHTDWDRVFKALPPPVQLALADTLDATKEWATATAKILNAIIVALNAVADAFILGEKIGFRAQAGMAIAVGDFKRAEELFARASALEFNPIDMIDVDRSFTNAAHVLREQAKAAIDQAAVDAFEAAARAAAVGTAGGVGPGVVDAGKIAADLISAANARLETAQKEFERASSAAAAVADGVEVPPDIFANLESARQALESATRAADNAGSNATKAIEAAGRAAGNVVVTAAERLAAAEKALEGANAAAAAVADTSGGDLPPEVLAHLENARKTYEAAAKAAAEAAKEASPAAKAIADAARAAAAGNGQVRMSLADLLAAAGGAASSIESIADRIKAATASIEAEQTGDVVKAFFKAMIEGTDPDAAIAQARAVISQQDTVWARLVGTLHDKLGIEVPDEFRSMWEQMTEATKNGARDTFTTWRDELRQRLASVGRLLPNGVGDSQRHFDQSIHIGSIVVHTDATGRVDTRRVVEDIEGAIVAARSRTAPAEVR